jgi:TonB family protein
MMRKPLQRRARCLLFLLLLLGAFGRNGFSQAPSIDSQKPQSTLPSPNATPTDEVAVPADPEGVKNCTPQPQCLSIQPPELLSAISPVHSDAIKKQGFHGTVRVYLWVGKDGVPSHVKVVQGPGGAVNQAVIDTVKQARFKAALRNGEPVVVDLYIAVNFH